MSGPIAVTLFIVGLLVSIMVHEWGHFAFARRYGMRADKFFVGFGPTVWSFRRGETEYGVKALPLGGFVRIRGMGETDERRPSIGTAAFAPEQLAADREPQDAHGRSPAMRAAVGRDMGIGTATIPDATWSRVMDLLDERGTPLETAVRLVDRGRAEIDPSSSPREARDAFETIVAEEFGGWPSGGTDGDAADAAELRSLRWRLLRGDEGRFFADRPAWQRAIVLAMGSILHFLQAFLLLWVLGMVIGAGATATLAVDTVLEDSPAATAGLEPGDVLVEVDGQDVAGFEEARDLIRARPGQAVELSVRRDGELLRLAGTPEQAAEDEETGETIGRFGFVPGFADQRPPSPVRRSSRRRSATAASSGLTTGTFGALGSRLRA